MQVDTSPSRAATTPTTDVARSGETASNAWEGPAGPPTRSVVFDQPIGWVIFINHAGRRGRTRRAAETRRSCPSAKYADLLAQGEPCAAHDPHGKLLTELA